MAYLNSLRYFEPTGTAREGATVFAERGCARCHGSKGEGTASGQVLRGRGDVYNTISLATSLWNHGPAMYRQAKKLSVPWPRLEDNDPGDLIVFLNSAREKP
jgi:cytochrome c